VAVAPTSSSIIRDSDVPLSAPVAAVEEAHGPIELVNQVSVISMIFVFFFFVIVLFFVLFVVFSAIRRKHSLARRD
jgi:hypothetical protein